MTTDANAHARDPSLIIPLTRMTDTTTDTITDNLTDTMTDTTTDTMTDQPADTFNDRQEEYDEMLRQLDAAAEACLWKIDGDGRITDPKKEQARSKWVNSLVRVLKERRQILEAKELEELEAEIEALKAERGGL